MFAVSKDGWQPLLSRDRRDRLTGNKQEIGLKHNDHVDLLARSAGLDVAAYILELAATEAGKESDDTTSKQD